MRQLIHILIVVLSITVSACFEIVEDVTINKDGSGSLKLILNGSQSKTDINGLLLLKEVNGYKVPSRAQIKSGIKAITDSIANAPGFSNVSSSFDEENFILILKADFDKVERLNTGIYKAWEKVDGVNAHPEIYYEYKNNEFKRKPGKLFTELYSKVKTADRKVMNEATYTALFRFEKLVQKQSNVAAKISKNNKVVFLKIPLQLMFQKPSYWYNIVSLQP